MKIRSAVPATSFCLCPVNDSLLLLLLPHRLKSLSPFELIHKCGSDRFDDNIFNHVVEDKKVAIGVDVASEAELFSGVHHSLLHLIARDHRDK